MNDMKFEIVVIPVSDVDRAKEFYGRLGWRLDADFAGGDDFRAIQFTPAGSRCSVIFGKNVTAAAPGSAQGLYLIVSDIAAARDELRGPPGRLGSAGSRQTDGHAHDDCPPRRSLTLIRLDGRTHDHSQKVPVRITIIQEDHFEFQVDLPEQWIR